MNDLPSIVFLLAILSTEIPLTSMDVTVYDCSIDVYLVTECPTRISDSKQWSNIVATVGSSQFSLNDQPLIRTSMSSTRDNEVPHPMWDLTQKIPPANLPVAKGDLVTLGSRMS